MGERAFEAGAGDRVLYCGFNRDSLGDAGEGLAVASSPVRCLSLAVENSYRLIAVRVEPLPEKERAEWTGLCSALKTNSRTRMIPLVALLVAPHRASMEDLAKAGVDYLRFVGLHSTAGELRADVVRKPCPEEETGAQLARICPRLHYTPIDQSREMAVCGAYRDRLVLGSRTLKDLCHQTAHAHCQYFLSPVTTE
ncbi:MAG: hypothetical protein AB1921_13560 [Thermodesulfobacteriota bacterium]